MAYTQKTLGFVAFLVPVPPKLWYLQHFHPFNWLARRQKLVVEKQHFWHLALTPEGI